jgi:hypothetical protein
MLQNIVERYIEKGNWFCKSSDHTGLFHGPETIRLSRCQSSRLLDIKRGETFRKLVGSRVPQSKTATDTLGTTNCIQDVLERSCTLEEISEIRRKKNSTGGIEHRFKTPLCEEG